MTNRTTRPFKQHLNSAQCMTREEAANAIFTTAAVDAEGVAPTLPTGETQLWVFCSNEYQREICLMPGRDVHYNPGIMTKEQWLSNDPAYIDGVLVQSRGLPLQRPCTPCQKVTGPFLHCAHLPAYYGDICGNCKYKKMDAECSLRAGGQGVRATCSWESFLQNETAPVSVSPVPGLLYNTEYMLGSLAEDFIIIPDDTWDDSGLGSSLESRQRTSSNVLSDSFNPPIEIESRFETVWGVFVPPIPSIEEEAGASSFNPILIKDQDHEMGQADTEIQSCDEDFVINIVDDKNEDPDYSQYSSSDDELDT